MSVDVVSDVGTVWHDEVDVLGKRLYVGNLPFSASEQEVRDLFEQHGALESVALVTDRETGRPRGFGFVEFREEAAAQAAQQALDGCELGGRSLRVNEAYERGRGGQRNGAGSDGRRY